MTADLRYAFRALPRSPGFTAVAVLSMALGLGANTAIFSVAHALLFEPLPHADADRLVILWNRSPGLGITEDWFSTAQYFDVKTGHSDSRMSRLPSAATTCRPTIPSRSRRWRFC